MPKTDTTVGGRFSPEEADRIETYAESRGISKSQALRELANAGLDIAGDEGPNLEASGDLSALTDLLDEAGQVQAQIQQKIEAQKQRVERQMADHFDLSDVDRDLIAAFAGFDSSNGERNGRDVDTDAHLENNSEQ